MIRQFKKRGITVDVVGIEDASKVAKTATQTARRSIFKTITMSGGGRASVGFAPVLDINALTKRAASSRDNSKVNLKSYIIVPTVPERSEWNRLEKVQVKVFRNVDVKSVADLWAPSNIGRLQFLRKTSKPKATNKTQKSTMFMMRALDPFAEGCIRLAYHAKLSRWKKDLLEDNRSMVLKTYKHIGEGLNSRDQYFNQMEVSTIAHFLANEYAKSKSFHSQSARIKVLQACVIEEEDTTNEASGSRRFCGEEPLPSTGATGFTKYSNNTGYWNEDHLDELLLRFTLFTNKVTRGYLMITDLQGVKKGSTYYLTDPAILCQDVTRFGNTNMGCTFMEKCVDSTRAHLYENRWA